MYHIYTIRGTSPLRLPHGVFGMCRPYPDRAGAVAVAVGVDRAMNVVSEKRPKLSIFQKIENMNLALNAARGIGCVVTNVNAKVRVNVCIACAVRPERSVSRRNWWVKSMRTRICVPTTAVWEDGTVSRPGWWGSQHLRLVVCCLPAFIV